MTNTNTADFQKNFTTYLNQAVLYNDVINVNTENGNIIVLSEEDYKGLMETLYLKSNTATSNEISQAMREPLEEGFVYNPNEVW